jgi:hypothetical protein
MEAHPEVIELEETDLHSKLNQIEALLARKGARMRTAGLNRPDGW